MRTDPLRKEVVKLAIIASDPLSKLGAARFLEWYPQVTVLPDPDRAQADVIVLIEDPVTDTVIAGLDDVCAELSRTVRPRCVVVADVFNEDCILSAVDCGVTAVLPKAQVNSKMLLTTILNAMEGIAHLPPRLQGALLTRLSQVRRNMLEPLGLTLFGLAVREQEVLRLVAEGLDTKEIAEKLAYSERTVKYVLQGIMTRYGLNNRSHAVAYAVRCGAI